MPVDYRFSMWSMRRMAAVALVAVWLLIGLSTQPAQAAAEGHGMNQAEEEFGKPNPKAAELSRFAFLIGRWRCEAKLKTEKGHWQTFQASWVGRYILDGYAIADDYSMTSASGEVIVLGTNFRTYDASKHVWNIKWLNALAGTWTDLGPPELGGVRFDGQSVMYAFKEPVADHPFTRATYTNISKTHFTWKGDQSKDGKNWSEFMVVEAYRVKE